MNPSKSVSKRVLMLLTNAFNPDPRVHREASALVRAGYQVTILCWDRDLVEAREEEVDGIRVRRVYLRSTHGRGSTQMFFLLLFWLKAIVKAGSLQFDVVHAHDFDTLPLGYILAKKKRARLVYDSHESYADMLHDLPRVIKRGIIILENLLLKRTDLVITVGELLRSSLERRGAGHSVVVGNWQDREKFAFDKATIARERERMGISPGQIAIVFIANLTPERQIQPLLEAAKEDPELFLILGGKGACAPAVAEAAAKYRNIEYLGFVNPTDIPLYTAISDVVFYGFDPHNPNARFSAPNKLFEALAAGKPLITGDFGEIGRIVKDRDCGVVIQNYSAKDIIEACKKLKNGRAEAPAAAAKTAGEFFTWARAESQLLQAYLELGNGGNHV